MFCPNCGQQIPEGSIFCPACGANLQYQPPVDMPVNLQNANGFCVSSVIRGAFASGKFLAMCILMSVATLVSCGPTAMISLTSRIVSTSYDFNLFNILITIAMWITFANAKSSDNMMSISGLKFSSGLAKATVIFNWIAVGALFVSGVVLLAFMPYFIEMAEEPGFIADFRFEMNAAMEGFNDIVGPNPGELNELFSVKFLKAAIVLFAVVFMISSVVIMLFNIFYYNKVHKFARNLHISYVTNKVTDLRFTTISVWFMVLGILGIICSFMGLMTAPIGALSSILSSVTLIVSSTWVKSLGEAVAKIPQPIYTNNFYNNNYNAYNNFNM